MFILKNVHTDAPDSTNHKQEQLKVIHNQNKKERKKFEMQSLFNTAARPDAWVLG